MKSNLERASTGIAGLDDVLMGGLPTNRLYLVQGSPGVGKTTMAMQFLREGVKQGEPVLYITLSETREELEQVAESHGWTLDGINLHELSSMEEYLRLDAENSVFHPSEVELSETTKALLALVERVNPRRVVFDSLSEMRLLARDPLRYRRQILALKQFFVGRGCTVMLLDDLSADVSDTHLESITHGVIYLEQSSNLYGGDRRRLRVQKLRSVNFRSGFHDMSMEKGGLIVYPRLVASEHRRKVEEAILSSGIPELDEMLGGGIDLGVSTLLMGPAGSGKSTLSTKFAVTMADMGHRVAMYLFEESPRTLYKRSEVLGMDLRGHVDAGRVSVSYIDPAELSPGEFMHKVRTETQDQCAKIVIIDSLNGYLNAMPEERFLILQLHELLAYLGQMSVSTFLVVAQHGMLGTNANAPVDVSYLADTVLLFRLYEHRGRLKQAISILKRRGGEHDRSIRELLLENGAIKVGKSLEGLRGVMTGVPIQEQVPEKLVG